jgi:hypothetical protein
MRRLPAFIGGFRSGSTLLSNYMGLHPDISAIYETKFLADLLRIARLLLDEDGRGQRELALIARWLGDPSLPLEAAIEFLMERALRDIKDTQHAMDGSAPDGKASHEHYVLGNNHILWRDSEAMEAIDPFLSAVRSKSRAQDLLPVLSSGIQFLFSTHAGREKKTYWINKTPEILRFFPELRAMFGRIRLIHLIRDGRDVVQSSVKLNWWSVENGSRMWKFFIEDVRAEASRFPEDYLELRYEQFVTDQAGTLRRVFDFLEVKGDPEEIISAQERFSPGSTSGGEAKIRIGKWRSDMSPGDRAIFKTNANDLLVALGYARNGDW